MADAHDISQSNVRNWKKNALLDRKEVTRGINHLRSRGKVFGRFPYFTILRRVERFSPENDGDRDLMDVTYSTVMRFAFRSDCLLAISRLTTFASFGEYY